MIYGQEPRAKSLPAWARLWLRRQGKRARRTENGEGRMTGKTEKEKEKEKEERGTGERGTQNAKRKIKNAKGKGQRAKVKSLPGTGVGNTAGLPAWVRLWARRQGKGQRKTQNFRHFKYFRQ